MAQTLPPPNKLKTLTVEFIGAKIDFDTATKNNTTGVGRALWAARRNSSPTSPKALATALSTNGFVIDSADIPKIEKGELPASKELVDTLKATYKLREEDISKLPSENYRASATAFAKIIDTEFAKSQETAAPTADKGESKSALPYKLPKVFGELLKILLEHTETSQNEIDDKLKEKTGITAATKIVSLIISNTGRNPPSLDQLKTFDQHLKIDDLNTEWKEGREEPQKGDLDLKQTFYMLAKRAIDSSLSRHASTGIPSEETLATQQKSIRMQTSLAIRENDSEKFYPELEKAGILSKADIVKIENSLKEQSVGQSFSR